MLIEDIEWVVEVICENKLYGGNMSEIKYNKEREEIAAWLNRIRLIDIPLSYKDIERSEENEEKYR
jgi:hypothetical protein